MNEEDLDKGSSSNSAGLTKGCRDLLVNRNDGNAKSQEIDEKYSEEHSSSLLQEKQAGQEFTAMDEWEAEFGMNTTQDFGFTLLCIIVCIVCSVVAGALFAAAGMAAMKNHGCKDSFRTCMAFG